MNVDELLQSGSHIWCPACRQAIIPAGKQRCSQCATYGAPAIPRATAGAPAAASPRPSSRSFKAPTPGATTSIKHSALGDLANYDDLTLWLVVAGKPETQGSMKAVAAGVVKHSNSKALHQWRDSITKEALRQTMGRWRTLNIPVALDAVFTVPVPKTATFADVFEADNGFPRIPPMGKPDVDKLLRAAQDALSPRDDKKKGETVKGQDRRFQLLADDSRIIGGGDWKTYPRPFHCHPWALDFPGAVLRITPLGADIEPMPAATLSTPAALPGAVAELAEQVRRREGLPNPLVPAG